MPDDHHRPQMTPEEMETVRELTAEWYDLIGEPSKTFEEIEKEREQQFDAEWARTSNLKRFGFHAQFFLIFMGILFVCLMFGSRPIISRDAVRFFVAIYVLSLIWVLRS